MRDRRTAPWTRVALVALGVLVAVACNPLLDQPTTDLATGERWRTNHYTYHGPPAWLAVRIDGDTGIDGTLTASAGALVGTGAGPRQCIADGAAGADVPQPCGGGCLLASPDRVVWSDGASHGYKRLFLLQEGDPLRVTFAGTAASVTPDMAAVDDGGTPVAGASFHDDGGPFEPIPWETC